MELINIQNVDMKFDYGGKSHLIFSDLSLSFSSNGLYIIEGPSGCGKSTLLKLIEGINKPNKGHIYVDGIHVNNQSFKELLNYRRNTCSIILQDYPLIGCFNAIDNLCLPLFEKYKDIDRKTIYSQVCKILDSLVPDIDKVIPCHQLSGGEQQRVCVARSIAMKCKVILADEPTGSLDKNSALNVMELLKKVSKNNCVIVVTHDHDLAAKYADKIYYLKGGKVSELPN